MFFGALALFPFAMKNMALIRWKPLFFLALILMLQVFSFLWSSDLKLGLRSVLGFLLFMIVTLSTYEITNKYPKRIYRLFVIYFLLLLIPVSLVIIFRLDPSAELDFLHSKVAKVFINPNTIDGLFNGARNNIFDPEKAGGFFVNGNVAAAFFGINALITYGFSKAYSANWLKIVTLYLTIGVIFTGSKAGIILIVPLLSISFIIPKLFYQKTTLERTVYILLIVNIVYFLLLFSGYKIIQSDFAKHIVETTSIRTLIWNYGIEEFTKHPIMGQGFGGWQKGFATYALQHSINEGFPPHNTFLYLWSQSGIFAVLFAMAFIWFIVRYALRLVKSSNRELIGIGIAVFGSYTWVFIHGMGTNFGLIGELHMEIVLAVLLGYSLARYRFYIQRYQCNGE